MTYQELIKKYRFKAQELGKEKEAIDFLVLETNNFSKRELFLNYSKEVVNEEVLLGLFKEYLYNDVPVQYLIGYTYFYGLKIKVNEDVLIPRFDSEILIETVLKNIDLNKHFDILEMGTGSGALAIALKKHLPNANIDATDISIKSLKVALENSQDHNVDINFFRSDLFNNVQKKYDVFISNPPYISYNEVLSYEVLKEPHLALFASNNGLYFYEEILKSVKKYLNENFLIVFEIGFKQAKEIKHLVRKYLNLDAEVIKDLQGLDRVILIKEENK